MSALGPHLDVPCRASGGTAGLRRPVLAAALVLSVALNAAPLLASWRGGASTASPLTARNLPSLSTRTIVLTPSARVAMSTVALAAAIEAPAAAPVQAAIREVALPSASTLPPSAPATVAITAATSATPPPAEASGGNADGFFWGTDLSRSPRALGDIEPEYPSAAGSRRGHVVLDLFVDEHGTVQKVDVVSTSSPGFFEEPSRLAFLAAHFEPGLRQGRAVKSRMRIEVEFLPEDHRGDLASRAY